MKKAVIVVGSHYAGKSKTINACLKPRLRIGQREHKFQLGGQEGFVLSQSREEAAKQHGFILSQSLEEKAGTCANVGPTVQKYSWYTLLVLAARPSDESPSCLNRLRSELQRAGYRVNLVNVVRDEPANYYDNRAEEIMRHLLR